MCRTQPSSQKKKKKRPADKRPQGNEKKSAERGAKPAPKAEGPASKDKKGERPDKRDNTRRRDNPRRRNNPEGASKPKSENEKDRKA